MSATKPRNGTGPVPIAAQADARPQGQLAQPGSLRTTDDVGALLCRLIEHAVNGDFPTIELAHVASASGKVLKAVETRCRFGPDRGRTPLPVQV